MPSCFVPGCNSGYRNCKELRRFFFPPKDKVLFQKWCKAVSRKDRKLHARSYICDKHFSDDFIVKADKFIIQGKKVELPRKNWRLRPDAIPHIFPNLPRYPSRREKKRRFPTRRTSIPSDRNVPLPEENLLDLHVTEIKTECMDHEYEVKSEMTFEETALSVDFSIVKNEAEEEFCDLDRVKQEVKLEVTAEENEVLTASVAVSHNSGVATFSENIPQEEYMHTDGKKYDCDVCGMCFPDFTGLKNHGLLHTGIKPFSCDVCRRSFSRPAHLKRHSRVHTSKKFSCDVCRKGFSRPAHLKSHSRVHKGGKSFSCDLCGKGFSSSDSLNMHLLVHEGEKPFNCDVCRKCFSTSTQLQRHSLMHTGEKPFSCDVCGRCFSVIYNLRRHSRLHTDEKTDNCHVCGRHFSYEASLKFHLRDVCGKTTQNPVT
ncbi:zinc finger protein 235-like isoform X2 [Periplaneta americana]|uniref:zinc finger protein 235-like isoform X2 n=1 Tax=Periplaneta americana TaxID=6978 RepID=UPI0037E89B4D